MIKREKIDASPFRQVLTALIVSDKFLEMFASKLDQTFFKVKFAQIICSWCLDFHKKWEQAPKTHIMDLYDDAIRMKKISEEDLELIDNLLHSLNGEYENSELNMEYLMDCVNKIQKKQDFQLLRDEINDALEADNYEKATTLVEEFQLFDPDEEDESCNDEPDQPFLDSTVATTIFNTSRDPLFFYPGAFGELINNGLCRCNLFMVRAQSGTGKTNLLNDFAVRACVARLNVCYIQAGDLSKSQSLERLFLNIGGIPRKPLKKDHCKPVLDCKKNQADSCVLMDRESSGNILDENGNILPMEQIPKTYKPCSICYNKNIDFPITTFKVPDYTEEFMNEETIAKWQRIFKSRMKGKRFFTKTYQIGTMSVFKIDKLLLKWQKKHNFKPDVLIIDYVDILEKEPNSPKEDRLIIEERYRSLMRLSQKHNCLTISAEQVNASAYNTDVLGMESFSGSASKNNNVTFGLYLTQNDDGKDSMTIQAGVYKDRYNEFNKSKQVTILQDLNRGVFHLKSFWTPKKEVQENNNRRR